jgi:rRNA-processing protein FCF1
MISIVVDTNLLKSGSTDFTGVQFVDKITSLIDKLESNDLYDVVQILIPQIVIDELFEHQIKAHAEKFSAIKSCKFPNFEVIQCDNYRDIIRTKFDIAIKELSLRDAKSIVLPYPENEVLPGIIKYEYP